MKGFEWVKRFDYSGERIFTKVFCINGGSGLPFPNKNSDALIISASLLDHDPSVKPNENIFWADKPPWYEAGIVAHTCSGFSE